MSGVNTKESKIARIRVTQLEHEAHFENIFALMRLNRETDTATIAAQAKTIKMLTETNRIATDFAQSLETENSKLRKYLGSELFARRQRDVQIPTLRKDLCDCKPGVCRGYWDRCRHPIDAHTHPLEPKWGNHPDPVPHNTKGTI
jgi:hypothetical protein